MTFDDTPFALRAKWEADKAGRTRVDDDPPLSKREFEDALRARPDELETYLVYADWLADHGDEWGQLITVQHALETLPRFGAQARRDELSRRETLLRFSLSRRLWGSLGEQVYSAEQQRYLCDLIDADWRCGFVHAARIVNDDQHVFRALVLGLADAPIAIVLRSLTLVARAAWPPQALRALGERDWPTLEWLRVDAEHDPDELYPVLARAPRLAEVEVNGVSIDLQADPYPQLCAAAVRRYTNTDE